MPCCGRTADDGEDSDAGADSQAEVVFATVNTQPPRTIKGAAAAAAAAGASAPPADQQQLQKEIIDKSFGGRRHDPVNAASAAAAKTPTTADSSSTPVEPNAATVAVKEQEELRGAKLFSQGQTSVTRPPNGTEAIARLFEVLPATQTPLPPKCRRLVLGNARSE